MKRSHRALNSAAIACAVLLGHPVVAALQTVFAGRVDLVLLDVVVLDRQHNPIEDLTASDFAVAVDGKTVPIATFAAVTRGGQGNTPDSVPGSGPVMPAGPSQTGRMVAIFMDRSISAGAPTIVARRIAHAVVSSLGQADAAAVIRTSPFDGDGVAQDFTTNRTLLTSAIDSPFTGLTAGPAVGPSGGVETAASLDDQIACTCGLCVLASLERVARAMSALPNRQKIIIFIGSDILVGPTVINGTDCSVVLRKGREEVFRALDRSNVTVDAVDPTGLETLGASASGRFRQLPAVTLRRLGNLSIFPDYTGGRTIRDTNAPEQSISALLSEHDSYYLLGVDRDRDPSGKRRDIRVTVDRKNVVVRTRRAYYSSDTRGATPAVR